jgi:hypothetical protein
MGKDGEKNSGEDGVSAPTSRNDNGGRDSLGRFSKGNPGGPGRPSRAHDEAVIAAIREHFGPEKIIALYEEALSIARKTESARGIMLVAGDALDRTGGKAIQRVVVEQGGLANILDELGE